MKRASQIISLLNPKNHQHSISLTDKEKSKVIQINLKL